jgi:hypothetical protein
MLAAALLVASCIVVKPTAPTQEQDEERARRSTPYDELAVYAELSSRADDALRRGDSDAAGALEELSELRVQVIVARLGQHGIKAAPAADGMAPAQDARAGHAAFDEASVLFGSTRFARLSEAERGRPDPVHGLLRKLRHARGKLLAAAGQREALIRELAPSGLWSARMQSDGLSTRVLHYQDIESCAPDEAVCKEAYRALAKATEEGCRLSPYVSDHFRQSGAEAYICDFINETWLEGTEGKKPFFYDVRVRGIHKTPAGELVVQGASSEASSYKTCDGQYQTDKILSVTDKEIVVERTTWCKGRRTLQMDGHVYVVRLAAGGFEPREGDLVRVFVRPKDVAIRKQGRVSHVTVNRPLLVQVSVPQGTRYRFGTTFDWQFAAGGRGAATR